MKKVKKCEINCCKCNKFIDFKTLNGILFREKYYCNLHIPNDYFNPRYENEIGKLI